MMKKRPVLGAFSGLCFGLFLALFLFSAGVIRLDSGLLSLLPVLGLVVGLAGALWAPLRRTSSP
jgi:hypothetical protein